MTPRLQELPMRRVSLVVGQAGQLVPGGDVARILGARGIAVDRVSLSEAIASSSTVIGLAPLSPPSATDAANLAPTIRSATQAQRPVVMLTSHPPTGNDADAAAAAHLRAAGAIACSEPNTWIEALVLLSHYGVPPGPRVAVIAPPGSWLSASAQALANQYARLGARFPASITEQTTAPATDIALVDRAVSNEQPQDRVANAIVVPVVARAELLRSEDPRIPLIGLQAALRAAAAAGGFARRLSEPPSDTDLKVDEAVLARRLRNLSTRVGDHETKLLLNAYGIAVTRQAVATTPSAATRAAKRAGYPVELKPWAASTPSEAEGCPVERDLSSAAEVRRAFVALSKDSEEQAVIVREQTPVGREVTARVTRVGPLGWMVIVDVPGRKRPEACPAPLSTTDAAYLASHIEATRLADPEPDRHALADILLRASRLVTDNDPLIDALWLHRIVVSPRGGTSVVVDARAQLRQT